MNKLKVSVLFMAAALTFASCEGLFNFGPAEKKEPEVATLADDMVDEMITEFAGGASASSRAITADGAVLDATSREAMRAFVKARIKTALSAAEKEQTDKIIPQMMRAVAQYVDEQGGTLVDTAGSADVVLVKIVAVAAQAAVKSAATAGRQSKVSNNLDGSPKPIEQVLAESTRSAVQTLMDNVQDDAVKQEGVGLAVNVAIAAIDSAATVTADKVQSVVQATVKASVEAVVASTTTGNSASVQDMVKQVTSGAVQASSALSEAKANDTLKQEMVGDAVREAVMAVVEGAATNDLLKDSDFAGTLVEQVAAGVSEAVQTVNEERASEGGSGGPALSGDAIASGASAAVAEVTDAEVTVVVNETAITAIVNETAPEISSFGISATVGDATVASAGGSLTLSAEPSAFSFSAVATPATGKTDVIYSWTQLRGPSILALGEGSGFTVSLDEAFRPGTYEFMVKVTNFDGSKSATASVTVTCTYTASQAQAAYAKGISYLKLKSYDAAYLQFAEAVSLDTTGTAETTNASKLWKAVLEISKLSVDPSIVDLARNKLGFMDYPSTMEALFSDRWLTGTQFYGQDEYCELTPSNSTNSWNFVPLRFVANSSYPTLEGSTELVDGSTKYRWVDAVVATGAPDQYGVIRAEDMDNGSRGYFTTDGTPNCFVRGEEEVPTAALSNGKPIYTQVQMLEGASVLPRYSSNWIDYFVPAIAPRMSIPASLDEVSLQDIWDLNKEWEGDETVPTELRNRYPLFMISKIMMANVINNYGSGLNALVDAVISGPLSKLDDVVATIESIPDDVEIAIPVDLAEAYGDLDEQGRTMIETYGRLNSAYLKSFAAQIMIDKSFMQMLSAYDLSYNMDALKPLMKEYREWDATRGDSVLAAQYDTNTNGVADALESFFANAESPFKTTLTIRDTARLADARASMKKALGLVQDAIDAEYDRLGELADSLPPFVPGTDEYGDPLITKAEATQLQNAFTNVKALFALVEDSLGTDAVVSIPGALFEDPTLLLDPAFDWTAEGIGMRPASLFDTKTIGTQTVGAFSPLNAFKTDAAGNFLVRVSYSADLWDPEEDNYEIPMGDFEDPASAASRSMFDVLLENVIAQDFYDGDLGRTVNFGGFDMEMSVPVSTDYLAWLGFNAGLYTEPDAPFADLALPFGGPWVGREYDRVPETGNHVFNETATVANAEAVWTMIGLGVQWLSE